MCTEMVTERYARATDAALLITLAIVLQPLFGRFPTTEF
jgi:hypothetical protein